MGTYVDLVCEARKKEFTLVNQKEFEIKLERVLQEGGIMNVDEMSLYGKKIQILNPIRIGENGSRFWYNYFEGRCWEIAGYDSEDGIYSGKVGWSSFCKVMEAAYVLQTLYMKEKAWVTTNGNVTHVGAYLGWFQYLFDERKRLKNPDLMELKEILLAEDDETDILFGKWEILLYSGYWIEGILDCVAVENGTQQIIESFANELEDDKENEDNFSYFPFLVRMARFVEEFKQKSKLSEEQQLQMLIDAVWEVINAPKFTLGEKNETSPLRMCLFFSGNFAFAIKRISEVYDKDFWELYKPFAGRQRKRGLGQAGDELQDQLIEEVSTAMLFKKNEDDLIFLWRENGKIQFSEELNEWLGNLKKQYNIILTEKKRIEKPVRYMVNVLSVMQEEYNILFFKSWLEDSFDHIADYRFHALWKLLGNMLEIVKSGNMKEIQLKRCAEVLGNLELRMKIFGV